MKRVLQELEIEIYIQLAMHYPEHAFVWTYLDDPWDYE